MDAKHVGIIVERPCTAELSAPGETYKMLFGKRKMEAMPTGTKFYISPSADVPEDIQSRLFALPLMNSEERDELLTDIHAWLTPILLENTDAKQQS